MYWMNVFYLVLLRQSNRAKDEAVKFPSLSVMLHWEYTCLINMQICSKTCTFTF